MQVLIIDDDQILGEMFQVLLRHVDCEVSFVSDGEEALVILSTNPPDVLVTDINLPSINGIDLIKHARMRLGMDWLQIVVITANAIAIQHPVLRYANEVIKKPVTHREFTTVIKRALDKAKPRPEEAYAGTGKSK